MDYKQDNGMIEPENRESNVRYYCRAFPDRFERAKGSLIYSESGKAYIDFMSGAGALNYGHNNPFIKSRMIAYMQDDGISHGLDMATVAKHRFITTFFDQVLAPRGLEYKFQFCGPTGTNAVEAALKLARKVTGRSGAMAFMGGFHGMTLGSLAVTSNRSYRAGGGAVLPPAAFVPFPNGFHKGFDSIDYIQRILTDDHSGIEKPAAIVVETVQAEGGVNVAPISWLQNLRTLCDEFSILLICDDIQVGCGRTGPFFSFERAGITPDLVTLSKSISGSGQPMSLLLIRPDLDVWSPAEHTGTFRGNQLAFVAATAAVEYFRNEEIPAQVQEKEDALRQFLGGTVEDIDERLQTRGIGMLHGIDTSALGGGKFAKTVSKRCFELGLIIECSGRDGAVLKIMPPLNIEHPLLERGCEIIAQALLDCLERQTDLRSGVPAFRP